MVYLEFSTIGKPVKYEKKLFGVVEDEVSILEPNDDRDFLDLIQYIKRVDSGHSIRICYYVRDHESTGKNWIFANRPLSINPVNFSRLLKKASKKKWFIR